MPQPASTAAKLNRGSTRGTDQSDVESCQRLHALAARRFATNIATAVDMVTSSSAGSSSSASSYVRAKLTRRAREVETACQATPASLRTFRRRTEGLTRPPLNRHRQRQLVVAYGEWATPLGAKSRVTELKNKVSLCDTFDSRVRAHYTVHEATTSYGKNMWVDQTVRNDTGTRVVLDQGGMLWARGVLPGYHGQWDHRMKAWLYTWGGSSADPQVLVEPGTSETFRAAVLLGYLPMRPDGTVLKAEPDLWLYRGYSGVYCRVHAGRDR
jgi:hypothetical protein